MQGGWQVLGPGKGAIVYDDSVAWEDRGAQGQGAQGKGERVPGWKSPTERNQREHRKAWGWGWGWRGGVRSALEEEGDGGPWGGVTE